MCWSAVVFMMELEQCGSEQAQRGNEDKWTGTRRRAKHSSCHSLPVSFILFIVSRVAPPLPFLFLLLLPSLPSPFTHSSWEKLLKPQRLWTRQWKSSKVSYFLCRFHFTVDSTAEGRTRRLKPAAHRCCCKLKFLVRHDIKFTHYPHTHLVSVSDTYVCMSL